MSVDLILPDQLECTLDQLDSTNLNDVWSALSDLSKILFDGKSNKPLQANMAGNEDRIVLLLSGQLSNFFTHYFKPSPPTFYDILADLFWYGPSIAKEICALKGLLENCTRIISRIYLYFPEEISLETTHHFVESIVPFLVLSISLKDKLESKSFCSYEGRDFRVSRWLVACAKALDSTMVKIIAPHTSPSDPIDRRDLDAVEQFMSVILRQLHDCIEDIHSESVGQPSCPQMDAGPSPSLYQRRAILTYLVGNFMRKPELGYKREARQDFRRLVNEMELSSVLYEMNALLEQYSKPDNTCTDVVAIRYIREFVMFVFNNQSDEAWSHMALIDKELAESGKSPTNIAIFKMLSRRGIVRPCTQEEEEAEEPEIVPDLVAEPEVVDSSSEDSFEHIEANPDVPESAKPNAHNSQAETELTKEEILRQVQKLHDETIKSQAIMKELLSKIDKIKFK